ncbi:ankyrin repeat domain-containing protein [Aspergillus glaucus CBS 516.65]|uniref:Uncharacterized protein n=1 Tax=Aspergillus glaucus CBS 516.65 TaxID=1160497 RepID=A0A1L9VN61_ASPGL|nr:hypothetical protein ASPGLDRAFT_57468 [Aspergillus glaucus CBS 516.65]OJJ85331.1 hypothetical protein ASPGLDRAFT_57468 [Aspergillus glaucus CBS 516.65]
MVLTRTTATQQVAVLSFSPFNVVIPTGRAEILNVLLEQQALAAAARRNDRIKIIPILLARGADINCQASRLRPLCRAVNSRNLDMVKFLLENGTYPSIVDSDGEGPLSEASGTNNIRLLLFLVDHGVDMSRCGGATLWWAVRNFNQEMIRFLLDSGAPMAYQREGMSILSCAYIEGNKEIIKILRESRH